MILDKDKYWVFITPKTSNPNAIELSIQKDYTLFVIYSYSENYTGEIPVDVLIVSDKSAY